MDPFSQIPGSAPVKCAKKNRDKQTGSYEMGSTLSMGVNIPNKTWGVIKSMNKSTKQVK